MRTLQWTDRSCQLSTWGIFLFPSHQSTRASQPVPAWGQCMYWAYLCWHSPISWQYPSHHSMGRVMRSDRCASIQHLPFLYFHSPLSLLPGNTAWQLSIWIPAELQRDGWINTEGRRQKERKSKATQGSLLSTRTGNNLPAIRTSFCVLLWRGAICVPKRLGEGSSHTF